MKKLFTLLTLLVALVTSAWADDTYTNEASTVTWAFTSHTDLTSVNVPADAFLTTNFSYGSNLTAPTTFNTSGCKAGWAEQTLVYFKPINVVAKNAADEAANMLEWTITPATGITFTPENVSITACTAGGTGDPQITIYAVYSDDTKETVQERTNPRRPDKGDQGNGPSVFSKTLVNAVAGTFKVRAYLAGLTNTAKGMAVTNIVVTGKVSGTPVATTTYTITAATNDASLGSVIGTATVAENEEVTLTATPTAAGYFVKWQKDDADFAGNTVNPLTVTATADATYTAIFEAKKAITFNKGEGTGTVPATEYVMDGEDYTTPKAFFLTKSGSSFSGWSDGVNTYAAGATISNVTSDITLTAQFAANTKVLGDAGVTVDWTFARNEGAPTIKCEGSELDYVQQVTIDGAAYDAVMHVNTIMSNVYDQITGKLNNSSNAGFAQVNKGTLFSIPAVQGMVVTYTTMAGEPSVEFIGFTDNGSDLATLTDCDAVVNGVLTYKYTGTAATLYIVAKESSLYPSGISVTYPGANEEVITVNSYEWTTLVSDKILDFTGSTVKAYVVTGHSGNAITLSDELTKVPANTPILLNAAQGSYTIAVTNNASEISTNLLKAGGASVSPEAGKTKYALSVAEDKATFKKIVSATTIPAGKAYLEFAEEIAAPSLSFDFSGTTGINAVNGSELKVNCEYYNLAGQRVANPIKGLYIVNGKKYMVK